MITKKLIKRRIREFNRKFKEELKTLIKTVKNGLKLGVLVLSVSLMSLIAYRVHEIYLMTKIGSQTLFIKSPKGAVHQGSATGFEIQAPSGQVYTLTNAHVCELAYQGLVLVQEKQNSQRFIPKRVIEIYEDNDLCLVEGMAGYEGLTLASSVSIGDRNYAIGYPLGEAMDFVSGIIKDEGAILIPNDVDPKECIGPNMKLEADEVFSYCLSVRRALITNLIIYPGNSGSPMVNAFGNVTGIIFAAENLPHWGMAVPMEDINQFLKAY